MKVEDIEALSGLPFIKPPPDYVQGSIESIRSSQSKKSDSSPQKINDIVQNLFARYEEKKKSGMKDKETKKWW